MKEARVYKDDDLGVKVKLHDVPIPTPAPDQVLIKVVVSGSNPKDWKILSLYAGYDAFNSGDDIAGIVESVGSDTIGEFKPGDRVAAFHTMMTPSGSFAEYALAPATTTFHIPERTSFEEAATIPLCAMTSALGLFSSLRLPAPWIKDSRVRSRILKGGIIIYGAASATGAFAIKLLNHVGIHPILCVAGNGIPFVKTLIDPAKGDKIIDYREGNDAIVKNLAASVPAGQICSYAYDTVADHQSTTNIAQVLDPHGHISLLSPRGDFSNLPKTVYQAKVSVAVVHGEKYYAEYGYAWFRLFSYGLQQGWLTGHPYEVCEGGLQGVEIGLRNLMNGKASAVKYVFRVADTLGLAKNP